MASVGHLGTHMPHPVHEIEFMNTPFGVGSIALVGQCLMHSPHELHFSGMMNAISGETAISPFPRKVATFEAVAMVSSVVSLMSFGPSAQPAMYMPSILVSTGLSLWCRSSRKLSGPRSMPIILDSSPVPAFGSNAGLRTTMSNV